MHILMVAAENGALPGGKVGGIGDVIRDVPPALSAGGDRVTVITPGYRSLPALPGVEYVNSLSVVFNNALYEVFLYRYTPEDPVPGVDQLLLDCHAFAPCGKGRIYCHDREEPFALDAGKFALFCNAVCLAVVTGAIARPDVIHLHDWHTAMTLFLRRYAPAFRSLKEIPCVYTVHNISIQGIRPFRDNPSSLEAWFPRIKYRPGKIRDPRYADCVNMMRMGINLADRVHVVSPTYAREVIRPSDPAHGFIGGEGLEKDLQAAARRKILFGILNGCEYTGIDRKPPAAKAVIRCALDSLADWVGDRTEIPSAHFYAQQRLIRWSEAGGNAGFTVVSIGRLSGQKVHLLREVTGKDKIAMEQVLEYLKKVNGMCIMLGSGDQKYEHLMSRLMARHENFIFLNGFSEQLAALLYRFGDLFLMPSSFEPCGISQMLAMRAGVPCLVHKTGGLADTVKNGRNGFVFAGSTAQAQAANMIKKLKAAYRMFSTDKKSWDRIRAGARDSRFTWSAVVGEYRKKLYRNSGMGRGRE